MRKLLLGSSPLTRGKRAARSSLSASLRLIPAHAGKTTSSLTYASVMSAHPRSRGENPTGAPISIEASGSSPLTRGKPRGHRRDAKPRRLIPAHAGKTARRHCAHRRRPAHPRSRGENGVAGCICHAPIGSSPLTRGKRATQVIAGPTMRLIPAHAGKTSSVTRPRVASAAHPRSRGENMVSDGKVSLEDGSSPLTRGKLRGDSLSSAMIGLIPAHAGKTVQPATTAQIDAAHPRSRGENYRGFRVRPGGERLIPAHAGKTPRR